MSAVMAGYRASQLVRQSGACGRAVRKPGPLAGQENGVGARGGQRQAGVWLPLGSNLDGLWPERPECRHQVLQGSLHSLRAMSIVSSGMHQERHIHQATGTRCRQGG